MKRTVNFENVPIFLNTEETQNLLGIKAKTIRKMARMKEIPAKKIGSQWRFSKEEIYEWLKEK